MRLKRETLLFGAAVAAISAGAALAADPVMAPVMPAPMAEPPPAPAPGVVITMYGGAGFLDDLQDVRDPDDLHPLAGFQAAALLPMGRVNVQLGGVAETGYDRDGDDTYGGVGFEAHVLGAMGDMMVGVGTLLQLDQAEDDWNVHAAVALEAGMQRGAMGFGFQLGYMGTLATDGDDRLNNAIWVRGMGTFALGSRASIGIEAAFYRGRYDSDNDPFRAFGLGAEAAFNVNEMIQAFVAVDALWLQDLTWPEDYRPAITAVAGIRLMLGGDMKPAADMPNFIRINQILAENN